MPKRHQEVQRLREITDPVERVAAIDQAMEDARALLSALSSVRGKAIYQVYAENGGGKAAKMLGMSRTALYRAIKDHTPSLNHKLRDLEDELRATAIELQELQEALATRQHELEEQAVRVNLEEP